jgi:hypothetical protein
LLALGPEDEANALTKIEAEIRDRFRTAATGGYRVEALLDAARQMAVEERDPQRNKADH